MRAAASVLVPNVLRPCRLREVPPPRLLHLLFGLSAQFERFRVAINAAAAYLRKCKVSYILRLQRRRRTVTLPVAEHCIADTIARMNGNIVPKDVIRGRPARDYQEAAVQDRCGWPGDVFTTRHFSPTRKYFSVRGQGREQGSRKSERRL